MRTDDWVVIGGPHDGEVVLNVPLAYYTLEQARRVRDQINERVDALEAEHLVRAMARVLQPR